MVKKIYHLIAGLALLHLLVFGGVVAYLAGTGKLSVEKLRAVVEVFHVPAEAQGAEGDASTVGLAAAPSAAIRQPTPVEREIARLNIERVTRAAEDQLKYASSIMVDIERRREDLQKQKQELAEARATAETVDASESFQKELEVLTLLKPKVALDNLLAREADAAARLMLELDSRTAKKIVEAASKDPGKWGQMLLIQERMRAPLAQEAADDSAATIAAPESRNPA